jgi:hypothetical protein
MDERPEMNNVLYQSQCLTARNIFFNRIPNQFGFFETTFDLHHSCDSVCCCGRTLGHRTSDWYRRHFATNCNHFTPAYGKYYFLNASARTSRHDSHSDRLHSRRQMPFVTKLRTLVATAPRSVVAQRAHASTLVEARFITTCDCAYFLGGCPHRVRCRVLDSVPCHRLVSECLRRRRGRGESCPTAYFPRKT